MRCVMCNELLSDFEQARRGFDGEYVDVCNVCVRESNMTTRENYDLMSESDHADLDFYEGLDNL